MNLNERSQVIFISAVIVLFGICAAFIITSSIVKKVEAEAKAKQENIITTNTERIDIWKVPNAITEKDQVYQISFTSTEGSVNVTIFVREEDIQKLKVKLENIE